MEQDALAALRSAIQANASIVTTDPQGGVVPLKEANVLQIKPTDTGAGLIKLDLDAATRFVAANPEPSFVDLRTVVNCWNTKDLSIADYIEASEEAGVLHLKFLERTDLLGWLDGTNSESEHIKSTDETARAEQAERAVRPTRVVTVGGSVKKRPISEQMQKIMAKERTLANHNTVLRGNRWIDFSGVSKDCHRLIMQEYKSKKSFASAAASRTSADSTPHSNGKSQQGKNKEPIILLSSSPSSLLNMANVKEFLESGVFEPALRSSSTPNLLRLSKESSLLGRTRLVVVDNVEKFKPEYWDRVVAVFVTGQAWQLKPYKWSDPNTLFRHVLGFALVYKGDAVPPLVSQWPVQVEQLDRMHRFRDREIVQRIWERIESHMVASGWPVKK